MDLPLSQNKSQLEGLKGWHQQRRVHSDHSFIHLFTRRLLGASCLRRTELVAGDTAWGWHSPALREATHCHLKQTDNNDKWKLRWKRCVLGWRVSPQIHIHQKLKMKPYVEIDLRRCHALRINMRSYRVRVNSKFNEGGLIKRQGIQGPTQLRSPCEDGRGDWDDVCKSRNAKEYQGMLHYWKLNTGSWIPEAEYQRLNTGSWIRREWHRFSSGASRGSRALLTSWFWTRVPAPAGGQEEKGEFNLPSPFCSTQALNILDGAHPHWGRQSSESTDSTTDLIWKQPHRHTQKQHLIWAPHGSVKTTCRITRCPELVEQREVPFKYFRARTGTSWLVPFFWQQCPLHCMWKLIPCTSSVTQIIFPLHHQLQCSGGISDETIPCPLPHTLKHCGLFSLGLEEMDPGKPHDWWGHLWKSVAGWVFWL